MRAHDCLRATLTLSKDRPDLFTRDDGVDKMMSCYKTNNAYLWICPTSALVIGSHKLTFKSSL